MILEPKNTDFVCTYDRITTIGQIIENTDGSVSVFMPNNMSVLAPVNLTQECCTNLGYTFDINTQRCLWGNSSCDLGSTFNVSLNPNGNDGAMFLTGDDETCSLIVEFDYLIKVKCETLRDLLIDTSGVISVSNEAILAQIEEQNAICEAITNEVNLLASEVTSTNYSITCDGIPNNQTRIASSITDVFANTAFGGTPTATVRSENQNKSFSSSIVGTFCLVEPQGLNEWSNILGPNNFQLFLDGDINSFTCEDVQTIYDMNENLLKDNPLAIPLIIPCDTPFGTKTDLIKDFNDKLEEQANCEAIITSLNDQLSTNTEASSCSRPITYFENLSLALSVEVVTPNATQTVYTDTNLFPEIGAGLLYNHLINNINSGFYVCGGDNCTGLNLNLNGLSETNDLSCSEVIDSLTSSLFFESGLGSTPNDYITFSNSLSNSAFTSNWLSYTNTISDQTIISSLIGNKVRFSLVVNSPCGDITILLDNIRLEKSCNRVSNTSIEISKNPGFKLDRIKDNKKSWLNNTTFEEREFGIYNYNGTNQIRNTGYSLDNEKLILNSKEIDLDVNIASAVETDVWCYVIDNPCLLSAVTTCNPCDDCNYKSFQDDECFEFMDGNPYEFMDGDYSGSTYANNCCGGLSVDFNDLTTNKFSATTIDNFKEFLTSELIDAKNRKTISQYATLKALYDRYVDSYFYCGITSANFNYLTMEQFSNLLGDYWVDIIEQVIPATTIWGSVKIYTNTIFDQQKFKYRAYSSIFCEDSFDGISLPSPINNSLHISENASVSLTTVNSKNKPTICEKIYITQMNMGSEFIGTIKIISGGDIK